MPTTREIQAKKAERLRREQRYYTPDKRGPDCWVCRNPTDPKVSAATGEALHPTCAVPQVMRTRR